MPAKSSFAALNLGMQTASLAVMSADGKGGLKIEKLAQAELLPDPSADATRAGQLQIALGELRTKLHWKGGTTGCAVPSQGVFTRFVKIPKVGEDQVGQVLHFEAQQNVPYAIEDVSWCYQVLPEKDPDKMAAILVAMKVDQVEATVGALRASHCSPSVIDTSPTALYNAFRFNYPDLTGCSLLIDIGARATNLLFIDGEQFFIRTLPIGGNSITVALQKKLEGRSLVEVEQLKRREGMLLPAGSSSGGSAEIEEMGKTARTVMTRIHNEITRSVTYYRTNQGGSPPVRAFLAGGGVSLPYTLEFFNEKLSLPVEFFNPLRNVAVGADVDAALLQQSAHTLGECVGIGLRLSGQPCPLELDLKAPSLEKAATEKKRQPFLAAAAALLVAAVALAGLHFQTSAAQVAKVVQEKLDPEINALNEFKSKLDALEADKKKLMTERADLMAAPALRTAWLDVINDLARHLPKRFIWVTKLRPLAGDRPIDLLGADKAAAAAAPAAGEGKDAKAVTAILVEGLYRENEQGPEVVDGFLNALKDSPIFDVTEENKASVLQVRATQSGEAWAYNYKMVLPLKRPIPL